MKNSRGKETGADIACQHLMHFSLFETKHVLCVDMKKEVFQGFEHFEKEGKAKFLVGDICSLKIPANSVDFVVSTHTLSHLHEDERIIAVKNLLNITKKSGDLLFNLPRPNEKASEKEIEKLLSKNFKKVKKIHYRNFISSFYEHLISDQNGRVCFPQNAPKKVMLMKAISSVLAVTDYIPIKRFWNYYFAQDKL